MNAFRPSCRNAGFTLVELILVMVISGIIAGAVVLLVRKPVENYVEVAERAELTETADASLRMMSRELRSAVANSVRIFAAGNVRIIEYIPSLGGGRYFSTSDPTLGVNQRPLSFTTVSDVRFTPVYSPPPSPLVDGLVQGNFIIVANWGDDFQFADAYLSGADNGNRAEIDKVETVAGVGVDVFIDDPANPLTSAANGEAALVNVFSRTGGTGETETARFVIAAQPVRYRCDLGAGTLTRITAYGFIKDLADDAVGTSSLVARNVTSCNFRSVDTVNRNNSLISLVLSFQLAGANQPTVRLMRQIQVDNTL